MNKKQLRSNSFVFRIWWEEETWRGWVQHAASGKSRYFEQLPDLLAFVEAQTGPLTQATEDRAGKRDDK
ncbi:MAG: hypothetical protein B6I35_13955 [Anaerolineaceae bacterium 4572_32.2]|nr:MAG: hypothetical protein B6I35_13955 [Anaerolineaceae bacterium 4572_32.2]